MELSSSSIKKSLIFFKKRAFIMFSGNGNPEKIPYISGNETFLYFRKLLIFQKITFQARKMKKTYSVKTFYISGNGTLQSQA